MRWEYVLNDNVKFWTLSEFLDFVGNSGYEHFTWNGRVYKYSKENRMQPTDIYVKDLK